MEPAGDSRGHGGFFYDKIFQPLLLGTIYADKDREEELIKGSAADWLIVRPGFLTNGPRTAVYRAITDLSVSLLDCFDVSANAAVPEQIHVQAQDRANNLLRRGNALVQPE